MKKVIFILSLISVLPACEQVNTGYRGVEVRFGKVNEEAGSMKEGLYFYNPMTTSIYEMDTRIKKLTNLSHTYTKDVQQSKITYVVNYNLRENYAHTMYKSVGMDWENTVLKPVVEGAFKEIIGQWDAVELISNRNKVARLVETQVKTAMADRGIVISRIELTNIDYEKQFEKAVENKVVAIQRAIEEQNKTKQVQEIATQKVIAAKADAESIKIRAIAIASNPKLIEYEAVLKWDGKLPYMNMGNTTPFINIKAKE